MSHREDLLAGAVRCLREKGYAHTTARDMVRGLGHQPRLDRLPLRLDQGAAQRGRARRRRQDFGTEMAKAIGDPDPGQGSLERFERFWIRVIDSFQASSQVWLATFDIFTVAQRDPEVRAAVADGLQGRQEAVGPAPLRRGRR